MCGINGAYFTNSSKEVNRALFEQSLNSIRHRGPDNQSSFIGPGIALGHNRLSIIDLAVESNQPFFSVDKNYAIVFNGEIFNYRKLKSDLELTGEKFQTNSDTEVLLRLLINFGTNALSKINGFFAFAFFDTQKHELILARDRFGEKPLFYAINENKDSVFFGSELKAVMPFLENKKHSALALKLLMHLTYIPAPYTIVEGVNKLEPGTMICISPTSIKKEKWYNLNEIEVRGSMNEAELSTALKNKFQVAVERRMVSDVPVAGFLSGGIDSTLVSAFAKTINSSYETFSLGFENSAFFDESKDAEKAAKKFNIHHHKIILTENEMLENVSFLLNNSDEPFGDSSMIALYSLCKKVKGKYKVMLSGDGADEVFAGYNKHYALYRSGERTVSNLLVKRLGGIHKIFPKSRNGQLSNKARQLEKMHRALNHSEFERYWYLAGFNSVEADNLLPLSDKIAEFKNGLELNNTFSGINRSLKFDVDLVLPNDMLYKVDMASMLNGIEIRSPFMDHELIEYAFTIAGELKIKNGVQKYLLKTTFKETLSDEIISKPKHGFEVPIHKWLTGPLKPAVDRLLSNEFINDQQIFNSTAVKLMLDKLYSKNPGDTASTVWTLLNFQYTWLNYFNA